MALSIDGLSRRYQSFYALENFSLQVDDGELIAILGPSGSGKTTLLRILAGLDEPDTGHVRRNDEDLLALDARQRHIGLVFQNYALFAHMTVAENVAFGLRVRPRGQRPARREIAARVSELLRRMQLDGFEQRYPAQLSGGQRQRVALARALAIEPSLLLLDEPFGALDAQVRVALRDWVRELQRALRLTTLLVTHDQEEALELADRIVVMNQGRIEQVGTPAEIYRSPATPFVHDFIGRSNRLQGRVAHEQLQLANRAMHDPSLAAFGQCDVQVRLRPEHVALAAPGAGGWPARIQRLHSAAGQVRAILALADHPESIEALWSDTAVARSGLAAGADITVQFRMLTLYGEPAGKPRRHVVQFGQDTLASHSQDDSTINGAR